MLDACDSHRIPDFLLDESVIYEEVIAHPGEFLLSF